jgi:hypothetical protein
MMPLMMTAPMTAIGRPPLSRSFQRRSSAAA